MNRRYALQLGDVIYSRIIFREMETNDTGRDHGGISSSSRKVPGCIRFCIQRLGAEICRQSWDNLITRKLFHSKTFAEEVIPVNMQPFVLEGGSIESDGKGNLLTTVECLSSVNRNEYLQQEELENYLKQVFGP